MCLCLLSHWLCASVSELLLYFSISFVSFDYILRLFASLSSPMFTSAYSFQIFCNLLILDLKTLALIMILTILYVVFYCRSWL